jgi:hypothetical protein
VELLVAFAVGCVAEHYLRVVGRLKGALAPRPAIDPELAEALKQIARQQKP